MYNVDIRILHIQVSVHGHIQAAYMHIHNCKYEICTSTCVYIYIRMYIYIYDVYNV